MSTEPKYLLVGMVDIDEGIDKEVVVPYRRTDKLVDLIENGKKKKFFGGWMGSYGCFKYHYVGVLDALGRSLLSFRVYISCEDVRLKEWFYFMDESGDRIKLWSILDAYLEGVEGRDGTKDSIFILWNNQEGKTPVLFSDWHPGIDQTESKVHHKVLEEV